MKTFFVYLNVNRTERKIFKLVRVALQITFHRKTLNWNSSHVDVSIVTKTVLKPANCFGSNTIAN